jgi:hypothetical protein
MTLEEAVQAAEAIVHAKLNPPPDQLAT